MKDLKRRKLKLAMLQDEHLNDDVDRNDHRGNTYRQKRFYWTLSFIAITFCLLAAISSLYYLFKSTSKHVPKNPGRSREKITDLHFFQPDFTFENVSLTNNVQVPRILPRESNNNNNDDTDRLDFSGGQNVDKAYRIGDVFVVWYLMWLKWDVFVERYATRYPNTLAHWYLIETGRPEYAMRNLTALLRVMDRKERTMHYRRAKPDEVIVHIRLGDVLSDPEYINVTVPIEKLWLQDEGFLNFDAKVKSNYNKKEYQELIKRIPNKERIQKCVIVGAHFIATKEYDHRNVEYLHLVEEVFREELHCELDYYSSTNPDKDLMFMASSHVIITAMGGYAQIAAACVKARGGHAIYDKFNGKIAGWNDRRFTRKEKRIYSQSYVDWSLVDYNRRNTTTGSQTISV